MGIKQEITMVKRNDGKKTACVNDIVTGVEMCKIDDNGPKDKDLSDMLRNMKLGESKAKKKFGQQQPQHEDDDEREDNGPRSDQTVGSDNLIKLEAPSSDDKEHDEDELQIKHEEGDAVLGERGPILGVPVNYNMEQGHNYIANKSCKPYQIQTNYSTGNSIQPALPANFPDYSYNASRTAQVKGSKREIDERERYSEPPKWIRPQNAGMMEVNNLSAPWSVPNSNAANTNGKTVSQVYRKQMSGGTVYTPEGAPYPVEQFFNSHDNREPLEFQDLFELGLDESAFNIAVDADDFLQTSGPPSLQLTGTVDQKNGQINNAPNKMSVSHQQWHNSQSSLPPVNQRTNSYPNHFQQQQFENYHQQTLRQYHEVQRGKRGSIGNDDYSDGYGSDLSPSHGVQSPPEQSPRSIMDASPGTYSGSPPQTNWSPPPSNMSDCSVDSGVCSPMTEDQNGYTSMKSPRQGYMMSPQSITSLPGTPQSRAMSTSPPHHYMSPTLTNSPSYQTVSHEQKVLQNDVYVSSFVDDHLTDLDCALEIASEDLMAERLRKGYQVSSVQSNGTNNNISHVNGVINNINVCLHNGTVNAPPRSFAMAVAPPNGTKLQDVVSTKPVTNSVMKEKSHGIPNLPMTVPTTVTLSNKNMIIYQQITNVNSPSNNRMNAITNNNINNVQSSIPGPFYLTSATTNTSHPPINNHGKIAIAPLNPKPTPQVQSQMVPVFVTRGGTMANTVIIMPNGPPNTPTRKLPVLIPKEPVKPKESVPEVSVKPSNVGTTSTNASSAVQGEQSTNVSTPDGKIPVASSDVKLLNLARRLVAEMETSDLKYQDEDGDTYLHVAVCKADKFMVQALLERLVREKLTEMIDMQNLEGQTPLYLAVSTNHTEMVQLLVEQGADVYPFAESITSSGLIEKTAAIHCASTKGETYLDTLKALLKSPAINLNQVNSDGHTALNCAILAHRKVTTNKIQLNSIPIIRALLNAGADPNQQVQQSGKTSLMYVLETLDLDLIESIFPLIDQQKLSGFLKTQAFDSSSCNKIAESLKANLDPLGQQRLSNCLKPMNSRGIFMSTS